MAKQTFTTGQVLLASQLTSLQQTAMNGGAFSAKTSSYTLVAADAGTAISMTSTSATTITVNTGLFAAGDTVLITNLGSGACVITAGTATVNTAGSLSLTQYEAGLLHFVSASSAVFNDYVQAASNPLTTTGDMIYSSSGSTQARLGIGSTSQVLTVSGGIPAWATPSSGSMTLLSTTNITANSEITVSSISGSYTGLIILIQNFKNSSFNAGISYRFNGDTGSNYAYNIRGDASGNNSGVSKIELGGGVGLSNSADYSTMVINLPFYTSTASYKTGIVHTAWQQNDGYYYGFSGGISYKSTSAISSFTLINGSTWAAQGTIKVYGVN